MLKKILFLSALFFFISSNAGSWQSKTPAKTWIAIAKPNEKDLELWQWFVNKYQIETINYERDIEFALPKDWHRSENTTSINNAQGEVLFFLTHTDSGTFIAIFSRENIESLRDSDK